MAKKTENPKEYRMNWNLKTLYNITLEDYNILLFKQEGKCAICQTHHTELKKQLAVDHSHETGIVRGLLCQHCNLILGHSKENITNLNNAIKYLKK